MNLTKSSFEWFRNNLIRDRSVPNFCGAEYEWQQTIRQWRRLLDAIVIYQILYANSNAAMRFSHGKSIDSDVTTVYRRFSVPVLFPRTGGKENWPTSKYYSWSCFWTIPKKFLNSRINLSVDCACHYYIKIP